MLGAELAALDFCYVTTTGRTTGKPHRIEIWFAADPERDTIFMMSGGRARRLGAQHGCRTALPIAIDLTPAEAAG